MSNNAPIDLLSEEMEKLSELKLKIKKYLKRDEPAREQMRRDLALAMGWALAEESSGNPIYPIRYQWKNPDGKLSGASLGGMFGHGWSHQSPIVPFDPFTDYEACHALKLWLAADGVRWDRFIHIVYGELSIKIVNVNPSNVNTVLQLVITADRAIVAKAAWLSINYVLPVAADCTR